VRRLISRLARKFEERLYKQHDVGCVEGVILVDLYDDTPFFRETITAAITLIKQNDRRRFARLKKHVGLIVHTTRPFGGAGYFYRKKVCEIDFSPQPKSEYEVQFYAAYYACVLVHESTHGELRSREIPYTPENRIKIEKLCMLEEARFARRLQLAPRILEWLQRALRHELSQWEPLWKATPWQSLILTLRRISARNRKQSHERRKRETDLSGR
jgi:hypothetical protein